ncbi:metallophosphoesterase family protein [Cytobacillus purgationiresistens]|uniref:Serine/threonine protein phosphatase 1 n=1 Tax=Cytobacillus purgationiresistens TaxID=863449 RepID=A0ABU0AB39_9BACI|nr:metallophosphoesterase family protein [Cytobacillus purgationiresistens]MDQ0268468.1 serine/threonine protein phosphatase 1 [Cytobacillus purgationiresistens]
MNNFEKAFVISDIHGEVTRLTNLMQNWNVDEMLLIIVGDLIDRGENSLKVVQKMMDLKAEFGDQVIILKGNHEDMLLKYLSEPLINNNALRYFRNGGDTTAIEFSGDSNIMEASYEEIARKMGTRRAEVDFLQGLSLYYEFGDVLFIHAGIDPALEDWRKTNPYQMVWIRNIWNQENKTDKIIVFGHTPTQELYEDKRNEIWISPCRSYINIDGGSVYGGQLNGMVINNSGEILHTYKAI